MRSIVLCIAMAISPIFAQAPLHPGTRRASHETTANGRHDFDFLFGRWEIHNRRLRHPLTGSNEWYEFESTSSERPLLDGQGSLEQYDAVRTPPGPIHAIAVRLYNAKSRQWCIYWSTEGSGAFGIPTCGSFKNGVGSFLDHEKYNGRKILVRFTWTHSGRSSCRFEQAFSSDNGAPWETNWIMDFRRSATTPPS